MLVALSQVLLGESNNTNRPRPKVRGYELIPAPALLDEYKVYRRFASDEQESRKVACRCVLHYIHWVDPSGTGKWGVSC